MKLGMLTDGNYGHPDQAGNGSAGFIFSKDSRDNPNIYHKIASNIPFNYRRHLHEHKHIIHRIRNASNKKCVFFPNCIKN